jgi:hypothetical protein
MRRRILMILVVFAIPFGSFLARAGQASDEELKSGCWFTPPDPPACDLCGDRCNPGQKCCIKIVLPT